MNGYGMSYRIPNGLHSTFGGNLINHGNGFGRKRINAFRNSIRITIVEETLSNCTRIGYPDGPKNNLGFIALTNRSRS